jgi:hypothetical protein
MPKAKDEKDEIFGAWKELINMTERQLNSWAENPDRLRASLSRERAKNAGADSGKIQSGHDSLHRIKRRVTKPKDEWTAQDYENAKQENSFNKRMLGNNPGEPVGDTGMSKWEISLRNWGHDPSKRSSPAHNKWKSWKQTTE